MRVPTGTLIAAAAVLAGCQPSLELTNQQATVQREILDDRFDVFARTFNNAEVDSVLAMFADSPEITSVLPDGTRGVGPEENETAVRNLFNSVQFLNFNPQNPRINVLSANTAVITFRHTFDMVMNDTGRDPFAGYGIMVWVRDMDANTWNLHSMLLSRNR